MLPVVIMLVLSLEQKLDEIQKIKRNIISVHFRKSTIPIMEPTKT